MASSSSNVLCKHNMSPLEKTVKKNGANKGRRFLRCPKWKVNDDCGFFKWVDGEASSCSRSSSSVNEEFIFDRKGVDYNVILEREIEKMKGDKKRLKEEEYNLRFSSCLDVEKLYHRHVGGSWVLEVPVADSCIVREKPIPPPPVVVADPPHPMVVEVIDLDPEPVTPSPSSSRARNGSGRLGVRVPRRGGQGGHRRGRPRKLLF
ncbi:hypothetical protein RND81_09G029700 [Saponaria officinalis]|uniref:GRF-type domain-containing protein n=1 Tax=Saponaria officinalis TaxID=3572 RepID=A0AAW1IHS6_SAPOF